MTEGLAIWCRTALWLGGVCARCYYEPAAHLKTLLAPALRIFNTGHYAPSPVHRFDLHRVRRSQEQVASGLAQTPCCSRRLQAAHAVFLDPFKMVRNPAFLERCRRCTASAAASAAAHSLPPALLASCRWPRSACRTPRATSSTRTSTSGARCRTPPRCGAGGRGRTGFWPG